MKVFQLYYSMSGLIMKKQVAFILRLPLAALLLLVLNETIFSQGQPPSLYRPIAAYHYYTPALQVRSLDDISVRFVNQKPIAVTNVVVKADIREPSGNVVSLNVAMDNVEAGADTLLRFPSYLPPSVHGKFEVVYSNNIFSESQDTVRREFFHSNSTFGSNNPFLIPGGVGPSDSAFIAAGFLVECGSLFFTGSEPVDYGWTTASFNISNIDEVFAQGDPGANNIGIYLYDADFDDDGIINLDSTWEDLGEGLIGYGDYIMKGTEWPYSPVTAYLNNIHTGDPLEGLKPNHPYYITLRYDGVAAGLGKCIRFGKSTKEEYPDYPSTPVFAGQMMRNGWEDGTVMLEFNYQTPIVENTHVPLHYDILTVSPNPAQEELHIDLSFDAPNPFVNVTLLDCQGRRLRNQKHYNFQKGRITFQVGSLPSGTYLVTIHSSEGSTARKLVINH